MQNSSCDHRNFDNVSQALDVLRCPNVYLFFNNSFFPLFQFKCGDIHFKKKEVYLAVSLATGLFLSAALVNDFMAYLELEMPEHTTQGFTFAIMVR
jgi:hypothetical protein